MRIAFYFLIVFVSLYGVFCTKGYNATACSHVCCMALFCLMVSTIKVSGIWNCREGGQVKINTED